MWVWAFGAHWQLAQTAASQCTVSSIAFSSAAALLVGHRMTASRKWAMHRDHQRHRCTVRSPYLPSGVMPVPCVMYFTQESES